MFSFFRALKVRHKLLILFGVLAVAMIFTTGREFYFFIKFDHQFRQQQYIHELSSYFAALQVRTENQKNLLQELTEADNEALLQKKYFLYQNERTAIVVLLSKIKQILSESDWDSEFASQLQSMSVSSSNLLSVNEIPLKNFVTSIYDLKLELLRSNDFEVIQTDTRIKSFDSKIQNVTEQAALDLELLGQNLNNLIFEANDSYSLFILLLRLWTLFLWIFGLALLYFLTIEIGRTISRPIIRINSELEKIAEGNIPPMFIPKSTDEIAQLYNSSNAIKERMLAIRDMANEIGNGNFYSNVKINFEEGSQMKVKIDLMKQRLSTYAHEREQQKIKDDIRNWQSVGLAKFSDILRLTSTDFVGTAEKLIFELINYLEVNQGGMFIKNEVEQNHPYLELVAWYAYDRKRIRNRRVNIGEELVGTVFIEGNTLYLKQLPEDYLEINSGLGSAQPTYLILVPLLFDGNALGVIELASFQSIEEHKIEFLETLAKNIASAIATSTVNTKTRDLLSLANKQSAELQQKQSELLESNKDLSMQVEHEQAMKVFNSALKNVLFESGCFLSFEFPDGRITETNEKMLDFLGKSGDDLLTNVTEIIPNVKRFMNEIARFKPGKTYNLTITFTGANMILQEAECVMQYYKLPDQNDTYLIYFHE